MAQVKTVIFVNTTYSTCTERKSNITQSTVVRNEKAYFLTEKICNPTYLFLLLRNSYNCEAFIH